MISLNSDVGEGYPSDLELMQYISYANIACGGHAGSPETIAETMWTALDAEVAVGAHPSYPDIPNFGRVSLFDSISFSELESSIVEQLLTFHSIADRLGVSSYHVKPHGALYNDAVKNEAVADLIVSAIIKAVEKSGLNFSSVSIMTQSGSSLAGIGEDAGFAVITEGFVDRRYRPNGFLVARSEANAMLAHREELVRQILGFSKYGFIIDSEGGRLPVVADTLCIHSDTDNAVDMAKLASDVLSGKVV